MRSFPAPLLLLAAPLLNGFLVGRWAPRVNDLTEPFIVTLARVDVAIGVLAPCACALLILTDIKTSPLERACLALGALTLTGIWCYLRMFGDGMSSSVDLGYKIPRVFFWGPRVHDALPLYGLGVGLVAGIRWLFKRASPTVPR